MSLRDYIAISALPGVLSYMDMHTSSRDVAVECFTFAEAFLSERARRKAEQEVGDE